MTNQELKKLNRTELLELLIAQMKANEALQEELEALRAELDDRYLDIEKIGSIAEASLKINGVFEAAEAAASQYVENVKARCIQSRDAARRAEEQAQRILEEARAEAENILDQAWRQAQLINGPAYEAEGEYYDY